MVGIQKCKNCGTKFKYNTLLKPLFGVANPVHCSNCGTVHYITWISKFALPALLMLPVLFKNGIRGITPNISLSVLIYLIYIVIIKALSPYIVRYKLSENDINKE